MPLDKDTTTCLENVKRGTPARFVMVNKGADVLSVVAFRKGGTDSATKRAKKLGGSGNVSYGVVNGSGANLVFNLATADGFKSEPVLATKLKAFLTAEESFKNLKPTFQIVDQLPLVVMDDTESEGSESTESASESANDAQGDSSAEQSHPKLKYRSGQDWTTLVSAIQTEAKPEAKRKLFERVAGALANESTQFKSDPYFTQHPDEATEQGERIKKVATLLQKVRATIPPGPDQSGELPPLPDSPRATNDNQPLPPLPDSPRQPNRQRGAAPNAQAAQQATQRAVPSAATQKLLADRQQLLTAATQQLSQIPSKAQIYKPDDIKKMAQVCEVDPKDPDSDFATVLKFVDFSFNRVGAAAGVENLQNAKLLAQQYLAEHKEPRLGKLPTRVVNRKLYCEHIIADCDKQLAEVDNANNQANALAKDVVVKMRDGKLPPRELADKLLLATRNNLLNESNVALLRDVAAKIVRENRAIGEAQVAQMQNPGRRDEAEVLNRYGCYKESMGGTSDVKLLQRPDGTIAYAFKSNNGESLSALDQLGPDIPKGACSIREDMSSILNDEIKRLIGLDLGFPKSEMVTLDGKAGALIEGIRGTTCDPEEMHALTDQKVIAKLGKAKVDQLKRDHAQAIETIPDTLSQDSLENVVLASVLSCQWDCKWGNMMIEGDKARPIDGGTAFPTRVTMAALKANGGPTPSAITCYPSGHSKAQTPMPQTQLPMDAKKVRAILSLDADALTATAKNRRDQLFRDNPNLDQAMLTDDSFTIVRDSIKASQKILRDNPKISAYDFSTKYTEWFMQWA